MLSPPVHERDERDDRRPLRPGARPPGRTRSVRRAWSAPPAPRRVRGAGLAAALVLVATACSQGEPRWQELSGWERVDVWGHLDVVDYDRVAATAGPDGVAWFTRARGGTDTLAYWSTEDGASVSQAEVAMPDDEVVIPVAVANGADGTWVAAAVSRERPTGENSGLVAWQSGSSTPAARRLTPPDRGLDDVPQRVEAARAGEVSLVAGVADGEAVAWRSDDGGAWRGTVLDLGTDGRLLTADVATDGERFVVAGVDVDGGTHLWTSADGADWESLDGDLPSGMGSATLLGPVEPGDLLVAWLTDDRSGDGQVALGAPSATVQRISGGSLTDEGTIESRPDEGWGDLSLAGATVSPEGRIVAVGTAWRSRSDRTPMVWAQEGDGWEPTSQPELAARLDFELRAVATASDDRMVGIVTPFPAGIDVEVWRWVPDD